MKNPRLYPKLWDSCYLSLTDLRQGIDRVAPLIQGTVVDYGSGSKPYRELFRHVDSYQGADFVIHDAGDIQLEDPAHLPLPDSSVDNVFSLQVLEHVPTPQQYLGECHRILKTGGRVLLTTHGTWCYHPGPNNGDFWRWTGDGLESLLQECGFVVEKKESLTQGFRCLLQIVLILRDPFRHRQTFWGNMGAKGLSLVVNTLAIILHPVLQAVDAKLDIIPIDYLILARKT